MSEPKRYKRTGCDDEQCHCGGSMEESSEGDYYRADDPVIVDALRAKKAMDELEELALCEIELNICVAQNDAYVEIRTFGKPIRFTAPTLLEAIERASQ